LRFIGLFVIVLIAVIYFLSMATGDAMIAVILGLAIFVTVVSGIAPSSSVSRPHS
jgi:hypothetical protein